MLFSLLQLYPFFRPSRPKIELLCLLSFSFSSSCFFCISSVMNSTTKLFSQKFQKVLPTFSPSVLINIFPAFLCLSMYSFSSCRLFSYILESLAQYVISPARQLSPLRMEIWSCRVSICSVMKVLMLAVSFLSQTYDSLYLLTVSLYILSSQSSKRESSSRMISSLSSMSWLWMLSLRLVRQSQILSLERLSSSNTTMCWQHFCLVSAMASCRFTQTGLLFSRKCCSVCSTMQLGHRGMRQSLSQQKLVRNSLGWQAQKIFLISPLEVWLTRDMTVSYTINNKLIKFC